MSLWDYACPACVAVASRLARPLARLQRNEACAQKLVIVTQQSRQESAVVLGSALEFLLASVQVSRGHQSEGCEEDSH